jgi:hypothetical protein
MNDTTRLILTVVLAAVLVALGIVGEEAISVKDASTP